MNNNINDIHIQPGNLATVKLSNRQEIVIFIK